MAIGYSSGRERPDKLLVRQDHTSITLALVGVSKSERSLPWQSLIESEISSTRLQPRLVVPVAEMVLARMSLPRPTAALLPGTLR
jgi:hypothetical protein